MGWITRPFLKERRTGWGMLLRCNGLLREAMEEKMLGKKSPGMLHIGTLNVVFKKENV